MVHFGTEHLSPPALHSSKLPLIAPNRTEGNKHGMRITLATAIAVILGLLVPANTTAQTRPNIVLIMVDDLSVSTLNRMASAGMLPNIKANLLDVGLTFNESFVTRSLGVPSRATSLTGLYAHNHRVLGHMNELNGGISHFNDTSTIATWQIGRAHV